MLSTRFSRYTANQTGWICHNDHLPLPSFVKFGKFHLVCENVRDDEVVVGSCGMEYSLQIQNQTLASVKNLELNEHRETVGFKTVKQLICEDDKNLCGVYAPSAVICTNLGYISGSVKWSCDAKLHNDVKFNRFNVNCENASGSRTGSNSSDIIIEGSCSLR